MARSDETALPRPAPPAPSAFDDDLLLRARRGDRRALNDLLAAEVPKLRRHAAASLRRELRGRMDPSDMVQTALLEAARDFPGFVGTTAAELGAWMRGILRRNMLDDVKAQVRAKKRAVGAERRLDETIDTGAGDRKILDVPAASLTSPSQKASRRQEVAHILALIEELPDSQRGALDLWLAGHPVKEIARRLERTELSVASLVKRALEFIRARTGDDERRRKRTPAE